MTKYGIMIQVTIHEAKTHLSRLIEKVMQGEEVVISKRNQPMVRLVVEKPEMRNKALGALRGMLVHESPDCWEQEEFEDAPTDPLDQRLGEKEKPTNKSKTRKQP